MIRILLAIIRFTNMFNAARKGRLHKYLWNRQVFRASNRITRKLRWR